MSNDLTDKIVISYQADAGAGVQTQLVAQVLNVSGNTGTTINNAAIAGSSAANRFDVACDVSQMAAFMIWCDAAVSVETYDGSDVKQDTITVAANTPIVWSATVGGTNPFDDDFVYLKVVKTTAGTAAFKLRILNAES